MSYRHLCWDLRKEVTGQTVGRCGPGAYCTCEEMYCGLRTAISVLEKKGLGRSRDDYAENTFRAYFEVSPSFMS